MRTWWDKGKNDSPASAFLPPLPMIGTPVGGGGVIDDAFDDDADDDDNDDDNVSDNDDAFDDDADDDVINDDADDDVINDDVGDGDAVLLELPSLSGNLERK